MKTINAIQEITYVLNCIIKKNTKKNRESKKKTKNWDFQILERIFKN